MGIQQQRLPHPCPPTHIKTLSSPPPSLSSFFCNLHFIFSCFDQHPSYNSRIPSLNGFSLLLCTRPTPYRSQLIPCLPSTDTNTRWTLLPLTTTASHHLTLLSPNPSVSQTMPPAVSTPMFATCSPMKVYKTQDLSTLFAIQHQLLLQPYSQQNVHFPSKK